MFRITAKSNDFAVMWDNSFLTSEIPPAQICIPYMRKNS